MSGRDYGWHLDIMLLVRSCCSRSGECCSIFRMRAVGHAHWRARVGRRQRFPQTMGAVLPPTMSPRPRSAGVCLG